MWSMSAMRTAVLGAAVVGTLVGAPAPALAGPPLICHPVDIGTTRSLPWDKGTGWDATSKGYDVSKLTEDVTGLLTAEAPVPFRRETLRRAAIYAARDPKAAAQLLNALVGRVLNAEASGR